MDRWRDRESSESPCHPPREDPRGSARTSAGATAAGSTSNSTAHGVPERAWRPAGVRRCLSISSPRRSICLRAFVQWLREASASQRVPRVDAQAIIEKHLSRMTLVPALDAQRHELVLHEQLVCLLSDCCTNALLPCALQTRAHGLCEARCHVRLSEHVICGAAAARWGAHADRIRQHRGLPVATLVKGPLNCGRCLQ